ncbi:hypothetical protein Ppa06_05350 [Planomonospora parontospora subsp. parontospora]|uniref:DUF4126 domain-containing protein n=3 Tax=Planomonospora parontospora TaxID=58119 RepID=A0AA37BCN0_9ACTN|nr:hypothetical protein GCM10010126_05360 [Planomonospora parontospora]GII06737.1 hypothetical protein Ppa06_05350 [Planomonospora parontospora subsp. parontospora]
MLAALTGLGLSTAAGLNAYIPLLVVGLLANLTDHVRLPEEFAWLSNGWVLAIIGVLFLAEVVLDKVPVVDSVNDMVQTVVRPASGGVVFSATEAAARLDGSDWMGANPWAGWVLGIGIALAVHVMKSAARPAVNASTAGVGAPVVSTVEDAGSLGISLIAVFLPVLVLAVVAALALLSWRVVRAVRRRRRAPGRAGYPRNIRTLSQGGDSDR